MSAGLAGPRPETQLPLARWGCLAALLALEVLALTLRFDTDTLRGQPGLWPALLRQAHHLPHLAVAVAVALLLFAGRRLRDELSRALPSPPRPLAAWACLVGHGAAFAAFAGVTALLLEGRVCAGRSSSFWIAGWIVLAAAWVGLLAAAALPPPLWFRLSRRCAVPVLAAAAAGFLAWVASLFAGELWRPLRQITFALVRWLLAGCGQEVVCNPAHGLIGTPRFQVAIAPECSGYEGVGLVAAFLVAYLGLFRRYLRFPQALLLLPLGTVAVYLANGVRIAVLVLIGSHLSAAVAAGGFHSQAGWLAFNAIALGLALLARGLPFFSADGVRAERHDANPTAPYLAPLLVIVATAMITGALSSGFDQFYPLRVLAAGAVLWYFRRDYRGLGPACRPLVSLWSWTGLLAGVGVYLLWLALEPSGNNPAAAALATGLAGLPRALAVGWLVCRALGAVVTVPLAEELAFRGYLTRRLLARDFRAVPPGSFGWVPFLASSLLFGALHGRWLAGTLAGMAYALVFYRRGRLGDAVLAHAVTNALLATHVLATGSWSLWC
jgi:exosortase E/protease (VPEID-CTERM system)